MTTRQDILKKIPPKIKENIYKRYKHGADIKEISQDYAISYPMIAAILKEIGGKNFKFDLY